MRKWIVNKLFDLMHWIDWQEALRLSQVSAVSWIIAENMTDDDDWRTHVWVQGEKPAPKRGRGRPKGSKNKPKVAK